MERYRSVFIYTDDMETFQTTDPLPSFSRFLKDSLGSAIRPEANTFAEMLSEDAVIEFPYAPRDGVHRVEGRAAIAEYVAGLANIIQIGELTPLNTHHTTTPDVVILEFLGSGTGVQTGKPYEQTYISVITLRDGYITHYRDYWNPLVAIETTGGTEAINAAVGERK